ncbi:het domain-containing protein [Colletotrichum kahawae]|uniref:Het domain-containing protein n=1 Tax=Colletotrichum kahawae TaxID=34407 RepID=A0AAE0DAR3_COLKA|nr:het domain-containing protein [Colletotrichum kahawae]
MKGFRKIRETCRLAARDGIKYAWVDTCCIDKSNSAELSEAINSMYSWYQRAKVCFAYLSDLCLSSSAPKSTLAPDLISLLRGCRWFSRGWTLQELIAPASVLFYEKNWGLVGNKKDWDAMLSDVTGISPDTMAYYDPASYSIAERMSWAATRETTREEDKAYSLLGIFDVNMPMLYGEGAKAFRRLQEEIIRTGYDVSIFAWTKPIRRSPPWDIGVTPHGAFADAPGDFHSIPARLIRRQWNEVGVTNAAVKLNLELYLVQMPETDGLTYVLPVCRGSSQSAGNQYASALGVGLEKIGSGRFVRKYVEKLVKIPDDGEAGMVRQIRRANVYILINPSYNIQSDSIFERLQPDYKFSQGCRVVKAWPSGDWNDAESSFMTVIQEPNCGSFLLEVQSPRLTDDGPAKQRLTGEFMFLFSSLPNSDDTSTTKLNPDLVYTIVGYREHQMMLDIINMRMEAGDMDAKEMRLTLRNFAIPRQQTAAVPVGGDGKYIFTVRVVEGTLTHRLLFRSSSVANQPWDEWPHIYKH